MKPLTKTMIQEIIDNGSTFPRKPEVSDAYNEYRNKLELRNIDISDFVAKSLFGNKYEKTIRIYAITLNSFPYNLEKGYYNYILWLNPLININEELFGNIVKSVKSLLGEDILMRQNPVEDRSVLGVLHHHIFSTKDPDEIQSENFLELLPLN